MTEYCFQFPFDATYILEWVVDLYVQEEEKHRELEIFAHISHRGERPRTQITDLIFHVPALSHLHCGSCVSFQTYLGPRGERKVENCFIPFWFSEYL